MPSAVGRRPFFQVRSIELGRSVKELDDQLSEGDRRACFRTESLGNACMDPQSPPDSPVEWLIGPLWVPEGSNDDAVQGRRVKEIGTTGLANGDQGDRRKWRFGLELRIQLSV